MTPSPEPGLCASCVHARVQRGARGSRFWRCALADADPRFLRYPRLPVLRCSGHVEAKSGGAGPG